MPIYGKMMDFIKEDDWKGLLRMKLRAGCKRLGI
jgi:hypothetical protein